ncbi:MAG: DUF3179 domain-containing protein [Desulfovibrionaceae bacterium]|nr:DUF3179 domain-containing protein [Desulfovibrionaceae bacterium]
MKKSRFSRFALAALIVLASVMAPQFADAMPHTLKELRAMTDQLIKTGLVHGDIPSLNSPAFVEVREASMGLEANDPVFVVPLPDGVRIYPQKILVWHEVVNEVIKGEPFCISYCPLSGCLAVYAARANNQNLILDAEGRLFNSNAVLIDRNTGSLWSQMLGVAIDGPLTGTGLRILPCYWSNWGHAREFYSDAKVLQTPRGGWRNYNRDPYGSYLTPDNYYDDERILYPLTRLDSRLPAKTQILGLEIDNNFMAVDVNYIRKVKVANFYSGLTPLVAIYDSRLDVARVFERSVWEGHSPALFVWQDGVLRDIQTRSEWDMDGRCVRGNLEGASMEQKFGIYAFWFAWAAFNPETELVPGPTVVPDSALVMGDGVAPR